MRLELSRTRHTPLVRHLRLLFARHSCRAASRNRGRSVRFLTPYRSAPWNAEYNAVSECLSLLSTPFGQPCTNTIRRHVLSIVLNANVRFESVSAKFVSLAALLFERRRDKHTHAHYLAIDGVCAERARATISKTTSPMYRIRAAATNEVRRHVRAHFYFRFRERDTVTSCQIVPERDDGAFGVDGTLSRSTVLLSCASASSCRRSCMVVCLVRAIFVLAPTTGARVNRKFF